MLYYVYTYPKVKVKIRLKLDINLRFFVQYLSNKTYIKDKFIFLFLEYFQLSVN